MILLGLLLLLAGESLLIFLCSPMLSPISAEGVDERLSSTSLGPSAMGEQSDHLFLANNNSNSIRTNTNQYLLKIIK